MYTGPCIDLFMAILIHHMIPNGLGLRYLQRQPNTE